MVNSNHVLFKANDRSYFAILKKEIHVLALKAGFSERKIGEIDIIVAEMASNLVKHAGGGHLLVKIFSEPDPEGIEIISIDNGPGMTDVSKMLSDGASTSKTLGLGLGAMKRLADSFQIFTQKAWGTVIVIRKFKKNPYASAKPTKVEIRSVVVAKPGEVDCGDGFFSIVTKDHIKLFLGDGLGHGPEAEKAVQTAGAAFRECDLTDPVEIIRYLNTSVRKTRGLVGTVAIFDLASKQWNLCGVGNISCRISGPAGPKNYMAYNGIIGLNVPRTLSIQHTPYEKGQWIAMCSDGLKSRWDTSKMTGIMRHDLSILAASLYKDFSRNNDDSSVAVCKLNI